MELVPTCPHHPVPAVKLEKVATADRRRNEVRDTGAGNIRSRVRSVISSRVAPGFCATTSQSWSYSLVMDQEIRYLAIASDPQVGQASVSLFTELSQCRHSYTTSGCVAQDSTRSTRSNSMETESLWVHNIPAFGALSVYCWTCLYLVFKGHVGRGLGLAEQACTERWWIRRGHRLVAVMYGREGARVTVTGWWRVRALY